MVFGGIMPSRLIRAVEENTVHLGIPLTLLMENAGKCVAELAHEIAGGEPRRILVIAGKGGNGGDGLVAARFLRTYGHRVEVTLLYPPSEVSHPDAKLNLEHLLRTGTRVRHVRDPGELEKIAHGADVIIDAILGTGVKPPLRPPVSHAVSAINSSKAKVIAIDVPTGIDPDKGPVGADAVKADYTVAMHYYKPGYNHAQDYLGELRLCNVGIPPEAEERVGPGHVKHLVSPRPRDAKKGDGGRILVIGGSRDYTGAPALAALAALSSGSDLASVMTPRSIRGIIASYSPELITIPASDEDYLTPNSIEEALHHAMRADAIVLGPGLSREEDPLRFASGLLEALSREKSDARVVVDADALKAITRYKPPLPHNTVLTPHRGEFRGLLEAYGLAEGGGDPAEDARMLSLETGATVLLKAPVDIICRGTACLENTTGNPGMSRGGTGDVLAGITATMLTRVDDPLYAAAVAAYVNGEAGDRALAIKGENFTTLDLLEQVPHVLREPGKR